MTDLKLEIEIINSEKKKVSHKRKAILFSILAGLWLVLLYSKPYKEDSIYDKLGIWIGFPAILFCVLLVSSGIILMYVFYKVPSKGKVLLNPDGMIITLNKMQHIIGLDAIINAKFYILQDNDETKVFTELTTDKIKLSNELNIPYLSERKVLIELIKIWKDKGVNIELKTIAPNSTWLG